MHHKTRRLSDHLALRKGMWVKHTAIIIPIFTSLIPLTFDVVGVKEGIWGRNHQNAIPSVWHIAIITQKEEEGADMP